MAYKAAYTVTDILRELKIGRATFYSLVNTGKLKTKKLGNRTFVLGGDYQNFLESLPAQREAA